MGINLLKNGSKNVDVLKLFSSRILKYAYQSILGFSFLRVPKYVVALNNLLLKSAQKNDPLYNLNFNRLILVSFKG